jgi:hypothetical protein
MYFGKFGQMATDGNIEGFVGRRKSSGQFAVSRIELGEIENSISQYSEDLQQVVVLAKAVNDEKVLIAYFTSSGASTNQVEVFYRSLPDYMVPVFMSN